MSKDDLAPSAGAGLAPTGGRGLTEEERRLLLKHAAGLERKAVEFRGSPLGEWYGRLAELLKRVASAVGQAR